MDINHLKHHYSEKGFRKAELNDNPFEQFDIWFKEAIAAEIKELNAMNLATVGSDKQPSLRAVLLKGYDENGFVFFTNYKSRKAKNIEENPKVALQFLWIQLDRQIRIEGLAEKTSKKESEEYFKKRLRESQLGAWASPQSDIISTREYLDLEVEKIDKKFQGKDITLPPFWGGYRVKPTSFEFWQGRANRLSDRMLYSKKEEVWIKNRLGP